MSFAARANVGDFGSSLTLSIVSPDGWIHVQNGSTSDRTLTATFAGGSGPTIAFDLNVGSTLPLPLSLFNAFSLSGSTSSSVVWWVLPTPLPFAPMNPRPTQPVSAPAGGLPIVSAAYGTAAVDFGRFFGVVSAATGATTVLGTSPIPQGTLVRYRGSINGALVTAADNNLFVQVVGHTSGYAYVTIFGPNSADGAFRTTEASEPLDIIYRNQDTVSHGIALSWEAFAGE